MTGDATHQFVDRSTSGTHYFDQPTADPACLATLMAGGLKLADELIVLGPVSSEALPPAESDPEDVPAEGAF